MFFAKSKFRSKIVILAGLEAILGHLEAILEPLCAVLGLPGGRQATRTGSGRAQAERFGTPPIPPKLLAKANSD